MLHIPDDLFSKLGALQKGGTFHQPLKVVVESFFTIGGFKIHTYKVGIDSNVSIFNLGIKHKEQFKLNSNQRIRFLKRLLIITFFF